MHYIIYNNKQSRLATVSGCDTSTTVSFPRRCEPYSLTLQTMLSQRGGASSKACLEVSEIDVYVRDVPAAPLITQAVVQNVESVLLSWTPPKDFGGCHLLNYSLYIVDTYNFDPIFISLYPPAITSAVLHLSLRPSGTYEIQLAAVTDAGESVYTISQFTAPDPQPSGDLTPGALAGITVGTFFGVVIIIGVVWLIRRWQRYFGYHNM